jgi:hypothetical protein
MTRRILATLFAACTAATAGAVQDSAKAANAPAALSTREAAWLANASRAEREGWIVLRLKGEPEAIGFQRGYLTAREIDAFRADMIRKIPRDTGKDWPFFVRAAKKLFRGRIPRESEREMEGIAAGARKAGVEISYDEVAFLNGFVDVLGYWWPINKDKVSAHGPGCSAFVATGSSTGGRGVVMGHNTWWGLVEGQHFNLVVDLTPSSGHRIVMQSVGPSLYSMSDFFVTDAGLVGTETTIGKFKVYRENGVPVFVRARRAMQYAGTIDDWVRLVAEKNNGAYANSWLLGDVNTGEIARFELGLQYQKLERTRDGWYSGSNVAEDPAILRLETDATYDDVRDPSVARRVRWEKLLADNSGRIDVALGETMLADHFDVYTGRESASCRTLCGHCQLDDGSVPGGWGAFIPVGAFDGKVIDTALARRLSFVGRWGSSCGTPFDAEAFLAAHPQYSWLRGLLRDLPSRPWVELPGGR